MKYTDPRVDAYIENAPAFARPILEYVRRTVHAADPEIHETIKWGMPYFERLGLICGMAAFRAHCALVFPKAELIFRNEPQLLNRDSEAMGQFGRLTHTSQLPNRATLIEYVGRAVAVNAARR